MTDLVKENLGLDDEESIQEYNKHPRFDPFIPYEELVDKKNADRKTSAIFVIRTVSTRWPTMSICTPRQAGMIQQMT